MKNKNYLLWSDSEMVSRSGSGFGTFNSCKPNMTFYPAKTPEPSGCVIICPGGGYETKTMKEEGSDIALMLNDHGISAFVLDYRVYPDLHPSPSNDAFRAIEMARDLAPTLGYRSDKIAICGFSAGGHLAACAGTMWTNGKSRPDAAILCYPVISMGKCTHIGSRAHLLGDSANAAMISDMSCENRVDRQTPPMFIWHTATDADVPVENALLMANALSSKGVSFELHIYPHGPHAMFLAENDPVVSTWSKHCVAWLKGLGF